MMDRLNQAEVLEQAADLIETVGHAKGMSRSFDSDGFTATGFCITGALGQVGRYRAISIESGIMELLHAKLVAQGSLTRIIYSWCDSRNSVIEWNDDDRTTKAEVIDLLKNTAKDIRNEGIPHE